MEGQPNLLALKFTAGNGEVTDVNDVEPGVHDPTMTGVHDYNSAREIIDSASDDDVDDTPDLIGVASDDDDGDFIPPPLTEPYYGGGDLWTYSYDSEDRSAPSVKSEYNRSVPISGLEDS